MLQSGQVWFRGQVIGVVVAESIEIAREAAGLVRVEYQAEKHDVRLRADSGDLYTPETVNPALVTDTADGDLAAALAAAPVTVDDGHAGTRRSARDVRTGIRIRELPITIDKLLA